ncbi:MAG: dihydropteroate synthase [Cytophagaceae bacterium]|nr:dihydropteroate synthase [Cytophagaceae bacterium]
MSTKDTAFYQKKTLNLKGRLLDLSYPVVMGILNLTPDSFYAGSRQKNLNDLLFSAGDMLTDGARLLDLGGYSSRPGAEDISEEEELKRVVPAVEAILKEYPDALLSIDTFRARVAKEAVEAGAAMINDISACSIDPAMADTIAALQVPYVLMHMRGTPQTMQQHTEYQHVLLDTLQFLQEKIKMLLDKNVHDIIVDPGFGFSKTLEQNYELLRHLRYFALLGHPVLAGISRKSMIYKTLNNSSEEALNGTTVLNTIALMSQVQLLRVHDVKEAIEAITLFKATYN